MNPISVYSYCERSVTLSQRNNNDISRDFFILFFFCFFAGNDCVSVVYQIYFVRVLQREYYYTLAVYILYGGPIKIRPWSVTLGARKCQQIE